MGMRLLILLCIPLLGCESLERLTTGAQSTPPQTVVYGDPHVIQGATTHDYQQINNVPTRGRTVSVQVRRPDMNEFEPLNQYEFKILTDGSVGAIQFRHDVILQGHLIIIPYPRMPAVPAGSEYIITATTQGALK